MTSCANARIICFPLFLMICNHQRRVRQDDRRYHNTLFAAELQRERSAGSYMLEHVFAECVPVFQFRQFGLQQVKQFAQVWRSIKFRRAQPPEPEESHVVRFQLQVRRKDNDRIADVVKNAALNRKQVAEAAGGGQTVGNVFVSDIVPSGCGARMRRKVRPSGI